VSGITRQSKRVRFYSTVDLVNALEQEKAQGKAGRIAASLLRMDLVILDELGYLPFSQSGGALLFHLLSRLRHSAARPQDAPNDLEIVARYVKREIGLPETAGIQEVFRDIAADPQRTALIAEEITHAVTHGRKVLVLTERTEHLESLMSAIGGNVPKPFVLHGRMSKKKRAKLIEELDALPPDASRVLLATGKLVGEGFDHPPLDTLILAMPISWKGTLQQYAGRLHRTHANKTHVRIVDVVDTGHSALMRMWERRQRGYKAMGYRFAPIDGESRLIP